VQIQRGLDDTAGSSSGDGEGSTVSIRGMRPDLNKTTVNGASQSSTTGGRDFNFSNLAPELVQRIEVFKTPTADQDEGAIGGTINLVTRKPREIGKFKAVGAAKITQHQLADATNYKLSGLVSNVFGDNDRVGALLSVNYSDDELRRDSVESFGWNIMTDAGGDTGLVARDIRPLHIQRPATG
jgi:iron complex outermembrane receptor protein